MTIWKFTLPMSGTIDMPARARILSAANQYGDDITVWAMVDPNAAFVPHAFRLVATGERFSSDVWDAQFIGTVLLYSGTLVLHVFDLGEVKP